MNLVALVAGYSVGQLAIIVILAAAVVTIVYVALRQFGVAIPGWVINVFWILLVAFVCVAAVRILMSM